MTVLKFKFSNPLLSVHSEQNVRIDIPTISRYSLKNLLIHGSKPILTSSILKSKSFVMRENIRIASLGKCLSSCRLHKGAYASKTKQRLVYSTLCYVNNDNKDVGLCMTIGHAASGS